MKLLKLLFCCILVAGLLSVDLQAADAQTEVAEVIKSAYFNGAFNDMNTASMRQGFHPDFAIFSAQGNEISRYPIDVWIKAIEKRKQDPNFDKATAKMDCKIISLDVTGGAAAAKIEMSKDGKMIYTDYLSLLKFTDGWKIVAKVYYTHPRN